MVPPSVLGNLRDKAKLGLVPRELPRDVELSPIDDGYVADARMSGGNPRGGPYSSAIACFQYRNYFIILIPTSAI